MTRIAIVGSSHVACLKQAWDELAPRHPGIEMSFLASPGARPAQSPDASPEADNLRPRLFGNRRFGAAKGQPQLRRFMRSRFGYHRLNLSEMDMVIWAGIPHNMRHFANTLATCDIEDVRETGKPTLMTRAAFVELFRRLARLSYPDEGWRDWGTPRVICLFAPAFSEICLASENPVYAAWSDLARDPTGVVELGQELMAHYVRDIRALGFEVVRQPRQTLQEFGLTRREFSRDAIGLRGTSFREEIAHANATYGKLVLEDVLGRLAKDGQRREAAAR